MIGDQRRVRFEPEIKQNFGEKEIGAMGGIDKAGIFADPADAGALGEIPLEERTRVGIPAVLNRTPNLLFDKFNKGLHSRWQDVVIICAAGIGSDSTHFL